MYAGSKRDQQVNVAAGMRLAARKRAEHFHAGNTVPSAEGSQEGLEFVQRWRIDIIRRNHIRTRPF
jgi:hypothetical protein